MRTVELTPSDAAAVTDLYRDHEWWVDRAADDVCEALSWTELALGVETDERLVAAARILTDEVFYATLYDVFVAEDRREKGVGKALIETVVGHDRLDDVETLNLRCREGLVPIYERSGFILHDPSIEVEGRIGSVVKMTHEG